MSRKQKLAEEMYPIDPNRWGTIPCHNDYQLERRKAFLAGYAACEQDAKVIEEKFEKLVKECLIEAGFREQEPHPTVKECVDVLAKWKERGE